MEDSLEIWSVIINTCITLISLIISIITIRKNKQIELQAKIKQLELEKRYANNRELVEEVYMIMFNIENLSCQSDYYLLKDNNQRMEMFEKAKIEAVNSLIWVKKRITILSVYSNKELYDKMISLLDKAREIIFEYENIEFGQFEKKGSDKIREFSSVAKMIITLIQEDNENISKNIMLSKITRKKYSERK